MSMLPENCHLVVVCIHDKRVDTNSSFDGRNPQVQSAERESKYYGICSVFLLPYYRGRGVPPFKLKKKVRKLKNFPI